jgi:flagellar protein FliJ
MAKRFKFRLEPLLKLRKQHEHQQQRAVADVLRTLHVANTTLQDIHTRLVDSLDHDRTQRSAQSLDVPLALQQQRYRLHLKRSVHDQHQTITAIETKLHNERTVLAQKTRERKVLETLRDAQKTQHNAKLIKHEQAEMDESAARIATQTH